MSALYEMFAVGRQGEDTLRPCLKRFREKRGQEPDCVLAPRADLDVLAEAVRKCGLRLRAHPLPAGYLLIGNESR